MRSRPKEVRQCFRKALLLGVVLAFCALLPAGILYSLASRHRALYCFFGERWLPFLVALRRLRSVPRLSHVPPLPGARGKHKVGTAYKWQLGDYEGLGLPTPEELRKEYAELNPGEDLEVDGLMPLVQGLAFQRKTTEPNDAPLIEGMHRIYAWDYICPERCWIRSDVAREEVSELEYQMSLPIVAVIDEEVYPFSTYWDQGAIIWTKHPISYGHCTGSSVDIVFFGGVEEEVAEAIKMAVEILADVYVEMVPLPEPSEYSGTIDYYVEDVPTKPEWWPEEERGETRRGQR